MIFIMHSNVLAMKKMVKKKSFYKYTFLTTAYEI